MDKRFNKLARDRKDYVRIAKKNGFYEGLKLLLSQLYPDSAHFIYELLQNAEDAQATEAQFRLYPKWLEFEHNGARLFNHADVEAITGISQSTKKDDGTAIGKFGIGFKSVYGYTIMPEIYSGKYQFSISESFIPQAINKARDIKPQNTLFVIPFDNPGKEPATAFREIAGALKKLDSSSLLFLKNILAIKWAVSDGLKGEISSWAEGHFTRVFHTDSKGKSESRLFLRFQKDVEIEDEDGSPKTCNIGISACLK